MRKRAWAALALFVAAFALSIPAGRMDREAFHFVNGLLLLASLGFALSLLRIWDPLVARLRARPAAAAARPGDDPRSARPARSFRTGLKPKT